MKKNINIDDIAILLNLSIGSGIDVYYNEKMGVFPTTIWDGYDNLEEQQEIIKKSIKLPKIKEDYIRKQYNLQLKNMNDKELINICKEIAIKWCIENNIEFIK